MSPTGGNHYPVIRQLYRYTAVNSNNIDDKNPFIYYIYAHYLSTHNISMTIENFLFQLVDELARKKADYTKHLETYRSMRSRFEEHFFKSKSHTYTIYITYLYLLYFSQFSSTYIILYFNFDKKYF